MEAQMRRLILAVIISLTLAGCGGGEPDPSKMATSAPPEYFDFATVVDKTGAKDFHVAKTARGQTNHYFGSAFSTLTVGIEIVRETHFTYHPIVEIKYADGSVDTCQEDDLRRYPTVQETTPYFEVPCFDFEDPLGAVVTVRDDWDE